MELPQGNDPLRIVMVISGYPPAAKAGAEKGCQRLAQALGRRGHSVHVITQAADEGLSIEREAPGVTVHRIIKPIALGPMWGLTYMRQVRRALMRLANEWDLVICHQLYLHSIAANLVARKLKKKSATLLVNAGMQSDISRLRAHRFGNSLVRQALTSDAYFALSNISAVELAREGIPAHKIWRYRYFVDVEQFAPRGTETRDGFLYVGRFHEQKNVTGLIDAFSLLREGVPHARLRLVGAGPAENDVINSRQRSTAAGAITIDSWTGNPAIAYSRALAVVSATTSEGLSNVMIEAMACGTPVIMTDVSGVRDALDPTHELPSFIPRGQYLRGVGGMIVPVGDNEALAGAMQAFMEDASLRVSMGAQARQRATAHYSEAVSTDAFVSMARMILAGNADIAHDERGFTPELFKDSAR